jgi:hypothetical protein
MKTQTQIPDLAVAEEIKNPLLVYMDNEIRPIYHYRVEFRETVYKFHAELNFEKGTYKIAEEKAKQFYLDTCQIPFEAWNYRVR